MTRGAPPTGAKRVEVAKPAERAYDLNRAAELRHGRPPELERKLDAEQQRLTDKQGGRRLLR
jgi:ATP-dependent Clp protease ATP-binding subunit ClpB